VTFENLARFDGKNTACWSTIANFSTVFESISLLDSSTTLSNLVSGSSTKKSITSHDFSVLLTLHLASMAGEEMFAEVEDKAKMNRVKASILAVPRNVRSLQWLHLAVACSLP
jgi:hypothetical protein